MVKNKQSTVDVALAEDLVTSSDFTPSVAETRRSKTFFARTVLKPAEPVEEVTIVAVEPTYNTNDLRVLQGLPQIEHLEPATVVVG